MSFSDDEEEFGFYNVYLCKKCDEAKPRKDFHKMYDRVKIEEVFYKTCKECRDKTKTTKEMSAIWVREFIETNYVWCDDQDANMFDVKEYVTDAYKKYKKWAIANDKGILTLKHFDNKVRHSGNIEVRTENESGKKYYRHIIFELNP